MESKNTYYPLEYLEKFPEIILDIKAPSDEQWMAAIRGKASMLEHMKDQKEELVKFALRINPEMAMPHIRNVNEAIILRYIQESRDPWVMPNMIDHMTLGCWMVMLRKSTQVLKFMPEKQRIEIIKSVERTEFEDGIIQGLVTTLLLDQFAKTEISKPFIPIIADPRKRKLRSGGGRPPKRSVYDYDDEEEEEEEGPAGLM